MNVENALAFFLPLIANLATMPTLAFMIVQLALKYKRSLDPGTCKRDPVRLLVLLQICFWLLSIIPTTIYRLATGENPGSQFFTINISTIAISCMVACGVTLLAYVYHKGSWMYGGWFFYAGMVIYTLASGNETTFFVLQFAFMIVGQMAFVLFYFISGIKYKDDKLVGLGLFFLMPVISGMMASNYFVYVIVYGFLAVYGIPYATGKVRFFKRAPALDVEACVQ